MALGIEIKWKRYLNPVARDGKSVTTCLIWMVRSVVNIVDIDMAKTRQFLSCIPDVLRVD